MLVRARPTHDSIRLNNAGVFECQPQTNPIARTEAISQAHQHDMGAAAAKRQGAVGGGGRDRARGCGGVCRASARAGARRAAGARSVVSAAANAGDPAVPADAFDAQDAADAESLFRLLETEIVPLYYKRDENNIPRDWVRKMKESIATLAPVFSTRRMVKDYVTQMYVPSVRAALAMKTEAP